ncbi:MAG: glycosyltransferase [Thermoleophilaceae bacterium]
MSSEPQAGAGERRALLVVRNTFEHDARVLRAALTIKRLDFDVTVLAVRGARGAPAVEERDGVHVVRVGPSGGLARRAYAALTRTGGRTPSGLAVEAAAGTEAAERRRAAGATSLARAGAARLVRWATTLDFSVRGIAAIRRLCPEIVQCDDYNTMWIGVAARLMHRSAVVYDSHELWPDRNMRPEARWWLLACEALFARVADAVVMTSPAHAEVLARRYRVPEPVVVRNIPAESARGRSGDGRARSGDGHGPVAIYVGGVLRHRGIEQSIRALSDVDRLTLRLLGPVEPDYRAELEHLARSAGVRGRVEFSPPVAPTEVVDALAGADVGLALFQPVCLSHRLVLPNKLFEYVRAGLPVVGSDLPMIARFVRDHDVGATVDPEDTEAIAAALAATVEPERNAKLRAAAERAGRTLDWRKERELLAGVYHEALARAHR